ncbi:hypothetical protein Scel_25890 [Streptomyces cellostaticus]|nr:hypothetical protein Scel_25890 [Streptomyces cellostaticus]
MLRRIDTKNGQEAQQPPSAAYLKKMHTSDTSDIPRSRRSPAKFRAALGRFSPPSRPTPPKISAKVLCVISSFAAAGFYYI